MEQSPTSPFLLPLLLLLGISLLVTYFLPAIVAICRKHPNRVVIWMVNTLTGWTFIVWVGCLAWALTDTEKGS